MEKKVLCSKDEIILCPENEILRQSELSFWEKVAAGRYCDKMGEAICKKFILNASLQNKNGGKIVRQAIKQSLLERVGFAWRNIVTQLFDHCWADIASVYSKKY